MSKPTKHYGKWRIRWVDERGERQKEREADERRRGLRNPPPTERTVDEIADYWERERASQAER